MIEPTETESKETMDAFIEAIAQIIGEDSNELHSAPHATEISRPDEVKAARKPVMRWLAT